MLLTSLLTLALALGPSAPLTSEPALLPQQSGSGGCIPVSITQGLVSTQGCLGDTVVLHVAASGSNLQYAWTHGGVTVPGASGDTLTLTNVTLADRGIWCVLVTNACSSETSCCRVSLSNCGGAYCTLTQGAYGNPNGQWNGMNRTQLITSLLAQGPLVLGKPGRSLTIPSGSASASCIIAKLPAGGPPAAFPAFGDQTLSSTTCQTTPPLPEQNGNFRNVLLGQTITLALNLRLDPTLANLVVCTQMTTTNGVFLIDSSVIDAMVQYGGGHGVANLLALANHALAGGNTGGVSLSTINGAVDAVNRAFDECASLQSCQ